jgi:uncharacterized ubiquitin-like protein YukD
VGDWSHQRCILFLSPFSSVSLEFIQLLQNNPILTFLGRNSSKKSGTSTGLPQIWNSSYWCWLPCWHNHNAFKNLISFSNLQIRNHQSQIKRVLDCKKIEYKEVDISASEEDKNKMRKIAEDDKALPPQIANGDTYCGVRPTFVIASFSRPEPMLVGAEWTNQRRCGG